VVDAGKEKIKSKKEYRKEGKEKREDFIPTHTHDEEEKERKRKAGESMEQLLLIILTKGRRKRGFPKQSTATDVCLFSFL